jgi:cell division protein FtsB
MKLRKQKKAASRDVTALETQIADQAARIEALTDREQAFREQVIRFLVDLRKGIQAINSGNCRFLTDILVERLNVFIDETRSGGDE